MSADKVMGMQSCIRKNSEELQTFFTDLDNWEKEMKKKDNELLKNRSLAENSDVNKYTNEAVRLSKAVKEQSKSESSSAKKRENFEQKQHAIQLKDLGNKYFKEELYEKAIECYTSGMNEDPENASLLANRAMAYLKIEEFELAEEDCTSCLLLDDTYVKAWLRRGVARVFLKKYKLAQKDFRKALEHEPKNRQALMELKKVEQVINMTSKTEATSKLNQVTEERNICVDSALHKPPSEKISDESSLIHLVPILPSAPEKAYQFSSDWRKLKGFPELQYKYVKQFPAENFPVLFQHSMEPNLFSEILRVLYTSFAKNNDEVYSYLKYLSKIGRFHMLTMLLSPNEVKDLTQLLNYMQLSKQCSKEEIDYIAHVYKIA